MRTRTLSMAGLLLILGNAALADDLTLDQIFPTDRVIDVQITVAPDDWDTIRRQSRNLMDEFAESRKYAPIEGPYDYVEAKISIDGVEFPRVGLRKKGFLGSQSSSRPSLKVKLHHVDPEAQIEGLKSLTFNNNRQDPSLMSQYIGYALFEAAGCPAPRCCYANVTVNGTSLGVYTHVESFKKPLLKRIFDDAGGTLYEGTAVDFYDGWEGSFERKRGDDRAGRQKLKELIAALNHGHGRLIDTEAHRRAWVPTSDEMDGEWTAIDFDDSMWVQGTGGAGYQTEGEESPFSPEFDFAESMSGKSSSLYLRAPFVIDDPSTIADLTLKMKFDDGFVAYLNGHRVASTHAPEEPGWSSRATKNDRDQHKKLFQSFAINHHIDKLQAGVNVLAIHGLNADAESPDLWIVPELWASDTAVDRAVADLVDLESFYRFWAMEGLLGAWDGYSGNRNNFFIYLNPQTGKFHFLPWGADALFEKFSRLDLDRRVPLSVKTSGMLAHRLYQVPAVRERYRQVLNDLLDHHFNEKELLAEIDRIEALLEPYVEKNDAQNRSFSRDLKYIREFVRTRRQEIQEEIGDGMPVWAKPPADLPIIPADSDWFGGRRRGNRRGDLWSAAREGNVAGLERHLRGVDVNKKDRLGSTALSWAAGLGRVKAVQFLIDNGADVNVRNRDGTTPLDHTIEDIEEDVVQFLRGAFRVEIDADEVNGNKPKIAEILRKHGARRGSAKSRDLEQDL